MTPQPRITVFLAVTVGVYRLPPSLHSYSAFLPYDRYVCRLLFSAPHSTPTHDVGTRKERRTLPTAYSSLAAVVSRDCLLDVPIRAYRTQQHASILLSPACAQSCSQFSRRILLDTLPSHSVCLTHINQLSPSRHQARLHSSALLQHFHLPLVPPQPCVHVVLQQPPIPV